MARILLSVLLLALSSTAFADAIRIKGKVISEGDTISHVHKILGNPDTIVQLENRYGGAVGQRYEYYLGGYNPKTVLIYLSNGRVQDAQVVLD